MDYDFNTRIDRRGTSSAKWDRDRQMTGRDGLLPFWVADMDFAVAPEIMAALRERLEHGVFGYSDRPDSLDEALTGWFGSRHDWSIDRQHILEAPGIVPFIHMAVQALTDPGDGIIFQEPVYYPFRKAVENNNRTVVNNPLVRGEDNRWKMDLDDLEQKISESSARLLIFCSPHNPVARVWEESELLALADLCRRHGVIVISDEIHADLVHDGYRHIPWLTLPEERRPESLTLVSATKTFNLPGLTTAYAIVPDDGLRKKIRKMLVSVGMAGGSTAPLSYVAAEAAWRSGGDWLDALMGQLAANDTRLRDFIAGEFPEIDITVLEGTYLEWLNLDGLGMDDKTIWERLLDAGFWPSRGSQFGVGGEGHIRINIACPASQLEDGLEMIGRALKV